MRGYMGVTLYPTDPDTSVIHDSAKGGKAGDTVCGEHYEWCKSVLTDASFTLCPDCFPGH